MADDNITKARLLADRTGISESQAEIALNASDGDLDKAYKMISSAGQETKIIVIKTKFFARNTNNHGLILIILDTSSDQIERVSTVITHNPEMIETTLVSDSYLSFESSIQNLLFSGNAATNLSQELQLSIIKNINEKKNNTYRIIKEENPAQINAALVNDVGRILGDADVIGQSELEKVDEDIYKKQENNSKNDINDDTEPSESLTDKKSQEPKRELIVAKTTIVISPAGGKVSKNLTSGDKILLKVDDSRPEVTKELRNISFVNNRYVIGTVSYIDITESESVAIHTMISPVLEGVATTSQNTRVKLYETADQDTDDTEFDSKSSANDVKEKIYDNANLPYIIMIVGGVVLFVIVLAIILLTSA